MLKAIQHNWLLHCLQFDIDSLLVSRNLLLETWLHCTVALAQSRGMYSVIFSHRQWT